MKSSIILCLVFAWVQAGLLRKDSRLNEWWKTTIVYQIYPRSFQDSDGDGTGDLKGIESRLEHLVDTGIETFWLSPIYKSPMADFGYDISNFTDVDPTFGSLADFQQLSRTAHELGLKVVMDFVPNHSSNEHPWFLKSVAREDPYTDYYIWADPAGIDQDGNPIPPTNWLSVFRFSAWEYNEERGQFYYHAFLKEQPDLNYRNPALVEEMKNVIRFWVGEQGVDGFRMDAVPFLFEDPDLKDEPESGKPVIDENDYNYLDHIYTFNLPEVYDMIGQLNDVLGEFEMTDGYDRVVMVEALSENLSTEDLMKYYDSCDFAFNFNLVVQLKAPVTGTAIETQVLAWLDNMPEGKTANWVLDNHDNWRVGTRFGEGLIDGFNFLALLLPGVAVTYNGDEIGMVNTDVSWEDTVDPSGCNCGPDHFTEPLCSRDPERTPMQWSDKKNAGFSDADKTWLPVNENYLTLNVENENSLPIDESHLKVYKFLTDLRKTDSIQNGEVMTYSDEEVFAFSRSGNPYIVVAMNTAAYPVFVDIASLDPTLGVATVAVRSINSQNPTTTPGSLVILSELSLEANEAVVIQVNL